MKQPVLYPAIQLHGNPDDTTIRALAGIKIVSILSHALRMEGTIGNESPDLVVKAAHLSLLQALAVWSPETCLSLNIVSRPQRGFPLGGKIEVSILLAVENKDQESATVDILNRHAMLLAFLRNYLPAIDFESVVDETELSILETPFAPTTVSAIVHKRQRFSIKTDHKGPNHNGGTKIGFLTPTPAQSLDEETAIDHVLPWVLTSSRDISEICETLLWHQAPIWLQVRLVPCQGSDKIHRHPLHDAINQCENLLSGNNQTSELLLLQASGLRKILTRRLQELQEPSFRAGIFLASTAPLDPAIIASVQHAIAPAMISDNPEDLFQGSSAIKDVTTIDFSDPNFTPDEDLFTPGEAACAFRIPHPRQNNCPGLPTIEFRTALANPQTLKSGQQELLQLGKNCHRGHTHDARISDDDRMRHMCILGQTGTGKSTLLENMLVQDIEAGKGCCLLDPHGDLVQAVLNRYPMRRRDDLVLVDFLDHESIIPMNLVHWKNPDDRDMIIDDLYNWMDMTYSMKETGGPIFEQYFRSFMRVLMGEKQNDKFTPTITDFCRIFTDRKFRDFCMGAITDSNVHAMIKQAKDATGDASLNAVAPYVTSKLNRFELDSNLRLMTGQEQMSLDFKEIMNTGKVMLVNLGRGKFGETVSSLLASQIVGRFKTEAMRRIGTPVNTRRDFFLYVDEFQNIASKSFMSLLSEARKYRLGLVLANQYADQLKRRDSGGDNMLSAILGNVATTVSFRVGTNDAELLESVFAPTFNRRDLINLPACGHCYVNMKIGSDKPISMSMQTINPAGKANHESLAKILRDSSNKKYAISRQEAEANLVERRQRIEKLVND
ncbi:MAG: type IV secretion system DNA-binding domain-containing protein [Candidatus Gracilibacteria bacterium]|nr:type IV secretion system DNA-binding domain-containing protein [Candidatus Gracilibacteria bacterium]